MTAHQCARGQLPQLRSSVRFHSRDNVRERRWVYFVSFDEMNEPADVELATITVQTPGALGCIVTRRHMTDIIVFLCSRSKSSHICLDGMEGGFVCHTELSGSNGA